MKVSLKFWKSRRPMLDELTASAMLEDIFRECDVDPNTIPMEEITSYSNYRKERFTLQRSILAIAMALFVLLPFLFVMPHFQLQAQGVGERKLPVYSVSVSTRLPVQRVIATMNDKKLPVYEASAWDYTIEPIRNGELTVEVMLFNRQLVTQTILVNDVDSVCPTLVSSERDGDNVKIFLSDEGTGVDYDEIYYINAEGNKEKPLEYDRELGYIVLPLPEDAIYLYVPDHIGNTIHLNVSLH